MQRKSLRIIVIVTVAACATGILVGSASAATIQLSPVCATPNYQIVGKNEIILNEPGGRVFFHVYASGWDPDQDGDPAVKVWQVHIDPSGYTSGSGGSLSAAENPCTDTQDCVDKYDAICPGLSGGVSCEFSNLCPGMWTDCPAGGPLCLDLPACDVLRPDPRCGSTSIFSDPARDDGTKHYMATLALDVSANASGTFTVGPYGGPNTFMKDRNSLDIPFTVEPALITIGKPPTAEIPTVSEWGIAIIALLLLVGAKVYFNRRSAMQA